MLWILDEVDGVIVGPASACDLASDLGSDLARPCAKLQRLQLVGNSTFARERDASITMGATSRRANSPRRDVQAVRSGSETARRKIRLSKCWQCPHACSAMRATAEASRGVFELWSVSEIRKKHVLRKKNG
jgi:hypothetical protein